MDYIKAHKYSYANRSILEKEKRCSCFYCLEIFSPKEIKEWWEDDQDGQQSAHIVEWILL